MYRAVTTRRQPRGGARDGAWFAILAWLLLMAITSGFLMGFCLVNGFYTHVPWVTLMSLLAAAASVLHLRFREGP